MIELFPRAMNEINIAVQLLRNWLGDTFECQQPSMSLLLYILLGF